MSAGEIIIRELEVKKEDCKLKFIKNNVVIQAGDGIAISNPGRDVYVISATGSQGDFTDTVFSGNNLFVPKKGQVTLKTINVTPNTIILIKILIAAEFADGTATWFEYKASYSYFLSMVLQNGSWSDRFWGTEIGVEIITIGSGSLQINIKGDQNQSMTMNYVLTISETSIP
jgi:hypothetical protein